ncbi:tripartite tricarboxylate transporter family receptor [Variibacter gotjawalensis]|uniref:Tripartite tricarboxylate transporter family receptor n=1 Tax=Variibacter gotjawalensis TaxID=1333996 RepID=A0A0S3PSV9_9BRAD|nr:tripartite tricarboxylate transporter substrate-binding protein [Variibacter gotjawalensis]NIK49293.1 tripartite-type tricarboxylate transporter receptor subunit TctC [Variibacter gotjawalensis]RZS51144.1 tripartite-type tricarboxylate transporter receptor subunit TctC [Variibacter gotjawalensis]BAT58979.1 tripartite tricarboxylate transporter family receptor [Variibacter gotjawalensis]
MLTRRHALIAGAAALVASRAQAQTFPSRPITIVVPYPAGGPVDLLARLIAQEATGNLGQPITVDNRGGGAGTIGTTLVARAEPDGHTLVLGTNQTHATNQSLLKEISYDGVKDFAPVIGIAETPHVLVVRKELGVTSVEELIALAKQKPGALNYGSTGNGSASHLCAELFKVKAGLQMQPVHFRGSAPMLQELLGERLDLSFATLPTVISQIDSGALPALAVASAKRAIRLGGVPTLGESGIEGVEADAWFTLFAPAKTPPANVERLHAAIAAALKHDGPKAAIAQQGLTAALRSPAEVAASLPTEVERWAAVIKAANIKSE